MMFLVYNFQQAGNANGEQKNDRFWSWRTIACYVAIACSREARIKGAKHEG